MTADALEQRVNEVAGALVGTCNSLESVATKEEINDPQFCSLLDEKIFLCTECGWWCDADEGSGEDLICKACTGHW